MFGITPFGWLHTLGSLPAIPAAAYMFIRYGRIVPRSILGIIYLVAMVVGALTVFPVAKTSISNVAAIVTLLILFAGYSVGRISALGRLKKYLETFCLTFTVLLLMIPTVSEILRRVPDGHPIAVDTGAPIIKAALGVLVLTFVFGVSAQLFYLFRNDRKVK